MHQFSGYSKSLKKSSLRSFFNFFINLDNFLSPIQSLCVFNAFDNLTSSISAGEHILVELIDRMSPVISRKPTQVNNFPD